MWSVKWRPFWLGLNVLNAHLYLWPVCIYFGLQVKLLGQKVMIILLSELNSNSHDLPTEKYFPEIHGQMWLWKLNGTNQCFDHQHCGRGFSTQVLRVLQFQKITHIIYSPAGTCTLPHQKMNKQINKKKI